MRFFPACLLIAALIPFHVVAQESAGAAAGGASCDAAYLALPHGTILDLLDPEAPADRRTQALSAYQRLASMKECPEFAYTLGQMYRHGPYLPGNPLPQDFDKARELILPMAEAGYLPAFADLAEMEMRQAHVREAMKWTQVYLYFVDAVLVKYSKDTDDRLFERSAYNAHLLSRVSFLWRHFPPKLPDRVIKEDLNAYLSAHEASVTQRMREQFEGRHRGASTQNGGPGYTVSGSEYIKLPGDLSAAAGSWIVEVQPSGQIGRVVLENLVPNIAVAEKIRQYMLRRYRFVPFDGAESRTTRVSIVVGSREGERIKRNR